MAPNIGDLAKVFQDLRSKAEDTRAKAAGELYDYVTSSSREVSAELRSRFTTDVYRRIFELIQSPDIDEKLGGIAALDKLIDFDMGDDNANKVTRFANYLRVALPGTDPRITIAATAALGHLATLTSTLATELVEFEAKNALEWLQGDRNEARRYAAVLVLKQLAINAPTPIYVYIPQILDMVWVGLRDPKVTVREGAAEALSECLALVQIRENQVRRQWYKKIFEEVQKGLRLSSSDSIHGSLLALRDLLIQAPRFVDGRYMEVCEIVLRYREHRELLVRQTIISIIPDLAQFDSDLFVNNYLGMSIYYLLTQIKREKDRSNAFLAIGRVGVAVGRSIAEYLEPILASIKETLAAQGKSRNESSAGPFQCISLLAVAVGPTLTKHIHGLLDYMFAGELTEPLRQALVDLSTHIPALLPMIQERLLNVISLTLCGRPYVHPGAPANATAAHPAIATHAPASIVASASRSAQPQPFEPLRDHAALLLALTTLGNFDFKGHMLHELVRECACLYLEDEDVEIRKAAALTCCQLLARDPICYQTSMHAMQLVSDVLEKLLSIAIADPDPTIRQTVLNALDERFDRHLAQVEHLQSILIALGDEVLAIRESALVIIGRLTMHNPAFILPPLRKFLIKLLTELKYSSATRQKEESAFLIGKLIHAAPTLVEPYVDPILEILLVKAKSKETGATVASQVLTAIGELANVAGREMVAYLDDLMAIILDTLQDQSSPSKREAALQTLAHVASSAGWVIEPYLKYPSLLNHLIHILKTEQTSSIRKMTVKVIGILGALDPYRHKITSGPPEVVVGDAGDGFLALGVSPSSDDYYPAVSIHALLKILRDPSLSAHHMAVVTAIMNIFTTLGLKCVPFLPQILPPIFGIIRTCPPNAHEFYFQQLSALVATVKQHIRGYVNDFIQLIQEFWTLSANTQSTALSLIEVISSALEGEFKVYLPTLLPMMLQIFDTDLTDKRLPSHRLIKALNYFGAILEDYLHLVIPAIVKVIERSDHPVSLRQQAILLVGQLFRKVNLVAEASQIIHALMRVLAQPQPTLRTAVMDTFCVLIYQMGDEFLLFSPMVQRVMAHHHIRHEQYETLLAAVTNNETLPKDLTSVSDRLFGESILQDAPIMEASTKKLTVNQQQLQKAWETTQRSNREDWQEWIRRFSVELLKESPSHALRACAYLAGNYYPLARELFNPAFVSCWSELYDQFQDELVRSLETALTSPTIPPEIIQTLLNLAEFMEHDDKALPIDIRTLGLYATKCHAYAKALHYKELEFISESVTNTIEALISINNQLQQPDSAIGILTYAQQNHNVELKESWYEKLHRWEDGLAAYEARQIEDPSSVDAMLGRMRCLHNLGDWDALTVLAQERWGDARVEVRKAMAPLAAAAAWGMGQWDVMDEYIGMMKQESPDSAFFRAILALHRNMFPEAKMLIEKTRELLDTELTALVGESYNRAYSIVVRIQMLAELEEIIFYKRLYDQPETQLRIRKTWMERIDGCQRNVEVWQRILKVRALVVSPREDQETYIKFANLCRKSTRMPLAFKTLSDLLTVPAPDFANLSLAGNPPQVVYACLKHRWSAGEREPALVQMREFTQMLVVKLGLSFRSDFSIHIDASRHDFSHGDSLESLLSLLSRCFLKVGDWQTALNDELNEAIIPDMLRSYIAATKCDRDSYKAWHAWALGNFEVLAFHEKVHQAVPNNILVTHVVPSVQGFFRSVALSKGNSLQDTLRLLTLWFKYGFQQDVNIAIAEGFVTVTIDTWLQVIPQLIARIHAPNPHVRRLIHQLLADVGREHPQALVYSLTVASKSQSANRKRAALSILDNMRMHSATLVEQAVIVSQELIRVAILWQEMWHEGLEDASRLYFGNRNIDSMFATLEPLHQMLERGPETAKETGFIQTFGRDLAEANDWCKKYKRTLNVDDLNQAWDLYYQVFKKITKQLPQLTTLELQHVSPKLLTAKDLELAVPGSYKSGDPVVRIASFNPLLNVMTSKQRPRRLNIKGSDGKEYQFLLKGHEDLRQDERVMQLFGLVNTLLSVDPETFKRHLSIQRYPVIPLSPNSGLIGWVPHCDTLHGLIRDYRESRKILLNIEHRLMLQMAPDYDNLSLLQKVEVFEYALENTTGQDLYKVLWLKSKNSEVWLDRRTNYTRSLAVMSMVGYILGLGDRHPSNLMLDRYTGKAIHIDFGDCFEVAIHRDRYPEKIPFRLTRMLINAMEVSGIEGNFRITCENVMRVLRENKDSLMAVLEAFVYDPLINWRLMTLASPRADGRPGRRGAGGGGGGGLTNIAEAGQGQHQQQQLQMQMQHYQQQQMMHLQGQPDDDADGTRPMTMQGRRTSRADADGTGAEEQDQMPEALNARAIAIINRVSNKLTGRDFKPNMTLDVPLQVHKLILQATSLENLSQCFIGWCPFW